MVYGLKSHMMDQIPKDLGLKLSCIPCLEPHT